MHAMEGRNLTARAEQTDNQETDPKLVELQVKIQTICPFYLYKHVSNRNCFLII